MYLWFCNRWWIYLWSMMAPWWILRLGSLSFFDFAYFFSRFLLHFYFCMVFHLIFIVFHAFVIDFQCFFMDFHPNDCVGVGFSAPGGPNRAPTQSLGWKSMKKHWKSMNNMSKTMQKWKCSKNPKKKNKRNHRTWGSPIENPSYEDLTYTKICRNSPPTRFRHPN